MNREAVALGTPVFTTFEGRLGAVDERLIAEGRLKLLRDPADVVVAKRVARAAGAAPDRIRRDPRDFTRLLCTPCSHVTSTRVDRSVDDVEGAARRGDDRPPRALVAVRPFTTALRAAGRPAADRLREADAVDLFDPVCVEASPQRSPM